MSDLSTNAEAVLLRVRSNLLNDLGNAAQAVQAAVQRTAAGEISDAAVNLLGVNTSLTPPLDPGRGRTLDILV
jgi:methionyl-tRNA synthetase